MLFQFCRTSQKSITIHPPELTNYPEDIQASVATIGQLRNICWRIKPWTDPRDRDRRLFTSLYGQGWGVDCDEVVTGIFVGDKAAIANVEFLRRQNITHVLNVAEGKDEGDISSYKNYTQMPFLFNHPMIFVTLFN